MARKSISKPTKSEEQVSKKVAEKADSDASIDEFDGFASTDDEQELELISGDEGDEKTSEKSSATTETAKPSTNSGVVYVGRIPHGFHEPEMRRYFSQFGEILRLRLSRNKRTGASKHYAFIEFESPDVADIVCDAMDNYLMFGHLLRVKRIQPAQMHKDLFVGANRRFEPLPAGERGIRRYKSRHPRSWWEEHVENDRVRRQERNRRLEALGIDYVMP